MVVARSDFTLRDGMAQDEMFIELMLLAAANWLQDRQLSLEQMRSEPDLLHYVAGWPRASDKSMVSCRCR